MQSLVVVVCERTEQVGGKKIHVACLNVARLLGIFNIPEIRF